MRHEQQIADGPGGQIIVQEKEIGGAVVLDGVHHGAVGAIGDGVPNLGVLAFELIPKASFFKNFLDMFNFKCQL